MKQQGKLPLANGEALLAAKSGREKGRNGFGRAALEVSFSGGGRLLGQGGDGSRSLVARIRALCHAAASGHAGTKPGLRAKGGSH